MLLSYEELTKVDNVTLMICKWIDNYILLLQLREQRKLDQENNPHYLKAPSKPKVSAVHQCGVIF